LEERVSVEDIGGEQLPYKDEFDMISMVVTLHEILTEDRQKVVEKAFQSLKRGGYLLALDFSYPDSIKDFSPS
jgi:SAM-dependent methyltransferase